MNQTMNDGNGVTLDSDKQTTMVADDKPTRDTMKRSYLSYIVLRIIQATDDVS